MDQHSKPLFEQNPQQRSLPEGLAHAISLYQQGAFAEAVEVCQKILRRDASQSAAWHLAGVITHQMGRHANAAQMISRSIECEPANSEYWNNLAAVCLAMGSAETSVECCRQSLRLRPDFPEAYNHLGTALRSSGRVSESVAAYRRALELSPDVAAFHVNLAAAYQELGQFDEALCHYESALSINPYDCCTYFNLSEWVQRGRYQFAPEQLGHIETLLQSGDLPFEPAAQLCFAAARTHEAQGRFAQAFALFAKGNKLRGELLAMNQVSFDPARHTEYVSRMIATFDASFIDARVGSGVASELPIFIVGMPRSGTTLAEQILSSHPAIFGAGELECIPKLAQAIAGQLNCAGNYPECLDAADPAILRGAAQSHLDFLQKLAPDALHVTDKLPGNFIHLGLIAILFPSARVIHCRRDPVDVCLSCFTQNFKADETASYCGSLDSLAAYYREYDRLMRHWTTVLRLPMFQLNYELLVQAPEAETRKLLAFCGVEWDDRCLEFHKVRRPVRTASSLQVREPITDTSIGRWKRYTHELEPLRRSLAGLDVNR